MRKKAYLIIYVMLIFFIFDKVALCDENAGTSFNDTNDQQGEATEMTPYSLGTDAEGYEYFCSYELHISISDMIYNTIYDRDNNIINSGTLSPTIDVLAGTSIGVNIHETKVKTWTEPTVKVTKKKAETYSCQGTYTGKKQKGCYKCPKDPITPYEPKEVTTSPVSTKRLAVKLCGCQTMVCGDFNKEECPTSQGCFWAGNGDGTEGDEVTSGDFFNTCKTAAENASKAIVQRDDGASYQLTLSNSNDINANSGSQTITGTGGCNYSEPTNTCNYNYRPTIVCMNVKTAVVEYKTGDRPSCSDDEIQIRDDGTPTHWHYFIPLNTKSTDTFNLSLSPNGNNAFKTPGQCKNFIDNNDNYRDWIVRNPGGGAFNGATKDDDKDTVDSDGGCKVASNIRIGAEQKFYHETGRTRKMIEGYELFYRPIDISNPFPNGISAKSYWKNLINNDNVITVTNASNIKKTYKLADSFRNWSYYIYDIDANAIRDYNKDNFYTSWADMKPDGTSDFIRKFNITRNRSNQEFYKLGCGPANSDWEECKS